MAGPPSRRKQDNPGKDAVLSYGELNPISPTAGASQRPLSYAKSFSTAWALTSSRGCLR
jgi:hypothetical protein